MVITQEERSFVYSIVNDVFQNYNLRTMEPEGFVQSVLGLFQSTVVSLDERQRRYLQVLIQDRLELYSRLADQRLQHILNTQNNQGFGAPGASPKMDSSNLGAGGRGQQGFFNGPKMYQLCQAVLKKLEMGS